MSLTLHQLVIARGVKTLHAPLSFSLGAGEALLLTGSNGSGKSTLLRMLAGLHPIRQGSMKAPNSINYIGHSNALSAALTPLEHLDYWGALLHAPGVDAQTLLQKMGLAPLQNTSSHKLSAGQKRRLALCRLLMAPAQLWLLDEPHAALDQEGVEKLTAMIGAHLAKGGSAVIASHGGLDLPYAKTLALGGGA